MSSSSVRRSLVTMVPTKYVRGFFSSACPGLIRSVSRSPKVSWTSLARSESSIPPLLRWALLVLPSALLCKVSAPCQWHTVERWRDVHSHCATTAASSWPSTSPCRPLIKSSTRLARPTTCPVAMFPAPLCSVVLTEPLPVSPLNTRKTTLLGMDLFLDWRLCRLGVPRIARVSSRCVSRSRDRSEGADSVV